MASEARKTSMPNLGKVKRGPGDEARIPWGDEMAAVLIGGFDLGSDRLFGDDEIDPKSRHHQSPSNQHE